MLLFASFGKFYKRGQDCHDHTADMWFSKYESSQNIPFVWFNNITSIKVSNILFIIVFKNYLYMIGGVHIFVVYQKTAHFLLLNNLSIFIIIFCNYVFNKYGTTYKYLAKTLFLDNTVYQH